MNRWMALVAGLGVGVVFFFTFRLVAYRVALSFHVGQLFWNVAGPPENLYGVSNLLLPRLVVHTAIVLASLVVGLAVYCHVRVEGLRFGVGTLLILVIMICVLLVIGVGKPERAVANPWRALGLSVFLGIFTLMLCVVAIRSYAGCITGKPRLSAADVDSLSPERSSKHGRE